MVCQNLEFGLGFGWWIWKKRGLRYPKWSLGTLVWYPEAPIQRSRGTQGFHMSPLGTWVWILMDFGKDLRSLLDVILESFG